MQDCPTPENRFILRYKQYVLDNPKAIGEETVSESYAEMLATAKFDKLKYRCGYIDAVEHFIKLVDDHILANPELTSLPRSQPKTSTQPKQDLASKLPTKLQVPNVSFTVPRVKTEETNVNPSAPKVSVPTQIPPPKPVQPPPKPVQPPPKPTQTPPPKPTQTPPPPTTVQPPPTPVQPPPFPYKKDLMPQEDIDFLWQNATTPNPNWIQLTCLQQPPFQSGSFPQSWTFGIPKGFEWSYNNSFCMIQIDKNTAYQNLDRLVDFFSEEARMQACRIGKPSPLEFYKRSYSQIQRQAQEAFKKDPNLPLEHYRREQVFSSGIECTTFKITLAKLVYELFNAKTVFDPSTGWGDRMLGAGAAGVSVYFGTDPNPALTNAYEQIREFLHGKGVDVTYYSVFSTSFLDFDTTEHESRYDLVFTSPPYYNYEIYSSAPGQSILGKRNVSEWINGFLLPYLEKAWTLLQEGGHLVLYISDVNGARYVEDMFNFVNTLPGAVFEGLIAVVGMSPNLASERALPLWIWRREEGES